MDSAEALITLARRALLPPRAERIAALVGKPWRHRKILDSLNHAFDAAIRPAARSSTDRKHLWQRQCYAFHQSLDFGAPFSSVQEAYDRLAPFDGWLIVLEDGSAGIYRPEADWNREAVIGG